MHFPVQCVKHTIHINSKFFYVQKNVCMYVCILLRTLKCEHFYKWVMYSYVKVNGMHVIKNKTWYYLLRIQQYHVNTTYNIKTAWIQALRDLPPNFKASRWFVKHKPLQLFFIFELKCFGSEKSYYFLKYSKSYSGGYA